MPSDDEGPSNHPTDTSEFETQFVPRSNDEEVLYEVEQITAEKRHMYRVKWAGLDPTTQKPWPQSWVDKHDCTDALVAEWKAKKAKKKEQRDGSYTTGGTSIRSRSSNSLPVAPSSRRTRRSAVSEPSPQIPSEDEHPTHASTSHSKKEQSSKRKRKSSSLTRRAVNGMDADEREGSSRPRKKRKISVEVRIVSSPHQGDRSANKKGNTNKEPKSKSDGDEMASTSLVTIGPPHGTKPQSSSGSRSRVEGAPEDAPVSSSKTPRRATAESSKKKTSPTPRPLLHKPLVRKPILSPGAVARLQLFDRLTATSPGGGYGDVDAPIEPSHKRPKVTPPNDHRDTIETPPVTDSSKRQSPQKTSSTSKLIKAMLPKLDSDSDSSPDDSDCQSGSPPPRPTSKSQSGTSRIMDKGDFSRRIDHQSKQDELDLPEIAVIPGRSSTTPLDFDDLRSSSLLQKTKYVKPSRSALKPVPQISPNTFRAKVKPLRPVVAVSSEPPPSSIESFASPRVRRPFTRKQLATQHARKSATVWRPSEDDVELDVEEEEEEEEAEEEGDEDNDEEAQPNKRWIDSEVRKRGKELFDEEQRRRDAKRAEATQPKRSKPLGEIMGRPKSAKGRPAVAGPSHNGEGVPANCLDSVVQEMEDAYVDLSGKTQSTTLETSASNGARKKPWAAMTTEEREVLRIQLRQEEEELTQEAIYVPAPPVQQDLDSYTYDDVEENVMQVSMDPGPPEPVQVESQERSTRTENIQQASVVVQASQGQQQSDVEDADAVQSLPQLPSSLPRDPSSYVSDTPKRRIHEALSLLNVKSEEIQRLQFELTQERQNAKRAQTELTKVTEECETLRTSVSEERVRLQEEQARLEERRKRWTDDRLAWTEEMERWKEAHDVWKRQRDESPHQQLKPPEQATGMNGVAKTHALEENRPNLNGEHVATFSADTLGADRKALIEARDLLSEKVSQLSASVNQMAAAKASVETDRDFFREQYLQASGFVNSVRAENAELEERVKIAEGQAEEGVAKIKQLFETKIKAFQDDIYRWKTLAEILQEKDSRTNDEVRTRAAQTTELESLCRTLLRDNNSLETDLRKLGRALQRVSVQRSKLSSKVLSITKEKARLRAKLAKCSDSQDSSKSVQEHSTIVLSDDAESVDPNAMDVMAASQPTPPHEEASFDGEEWFACLWRHQLELCPRIFDCKEDLLRHMSEHVS